jgi:hypothetical protein
MMQSVPGTYNQAPATLQPGVPGSGGFVMPQGQ